MTDVGFESSNKEKSVPTIRDVTNENDATRLVVGCHGDKSAVWFV